MFHLMKIVVPRVATRWKDFAIALDYDDYTVQYIESRYCNDPGECCKELLKDWLTTENGAKPKFWSTLLDTFTELDLPVAKEEIIRELSQI